MCQTPRILKRTRHSPHLPRIYSLVRRQTKATVGYGKLCDGTGEGVMVTYNKDLIICEAYKHPARVLQICFQPQFYPELQTLYLTQLTRHLHLQFCSSLRVKHIYNGNDYILPRAVVNPG